MTKTLDEKIEDLELVIERCSELKSFYNTSDREMMMYYQGKYDAYSATLIILESLKENN